MFEVNEEEESEEKISEEEIERLAKEYGVSVELVRRYVKLLSSSVLITNPDAYKAALEEAVQIAAPPVSFQPGVDEKYKEPGLEAPLVLKKALSIVLSASDGEIAEDVASMIAEEAERAPSHHRRK